MRLNFAAMKHAFHLIEAVFYRWSVCFRKMMNCQSSALVETVSINYEDFNESFLTCSTCLNMYDGVEHPPKLLPCSHTVRISAMCVERLLLFFESYAMLCVRVVGRINYLGFINYQHLVGLARSCPSYFLPLEESCYYRCWQVSWNDSWWNEIWMRWQNLITRYGHAALASLAVSLDLWN